ncbi:MAG: trypsin-like peptidase domain-containing protein [Actinomycetota bacterium]
MADDTPDAVEDSQAPFIYERNEDADSGVGQDMEPTTDDERLTIDYERSTTEEPFVPFVYDDPAPLPPTEQKPEPVSARISPVSPKKRGNAALFLGGTLVAGILGAVLTVGVLAATGTFDDPDATTTPPTTVVSGEQAAQDVETQPIQIINDLGAAVNPTAIARKTMPSIVTVKVGDASADDESPTVPIGSGSGVVMSAEGHVITNHHVIQGGDTFQVTFEDGRVYDATLVGSDDLTDIAVLQIDASDLTPADFGTTEFLDVGDPAVAIGNPLGQDGGASVTVGIISAFNRRVDFADKTSLSGMIQTDAAINSGSSGGGLFDVSGNLIGITSAIGVSQAGPEGIGYAIPIELVDRITAEIIETGDIAHPFLGVTVGNHFEQAEDGAIVPAGGLIHSIEGTDSAAGLAGLQAGDVVKAIGGTQISSQADLVLAVRLYRVGDEVTFVAEREGEEMTFTIVLGQRPTEFQG